MPRARVYGHLSARRVYIETVHCKLNNDRVAKCEVQGREERGKKKKKKSHSKQTCAMCGGTWDQSGNIAVRHSELSGAPHRNTATTFFYLPLFPHARAINLGIPFPASERAGGRPFAPYFERLSDARYISSRSDSGLNNAQRMPAG